MKKIMALVLLCFIFVFIGNTRSFAGQYDVLPNGMNYLSLSNIRPLEDSPYYAETIEPIRIQINTTYTLIFDYAFLGQHTTDLSGIYVTIEEEGDNDSYTHYLTDDRNLELAYVEFSTEIDMIDITYMPNGLENAYNIMLYEGTYEDFTGFVPYVHPSEVMTYQGLFPMDYDNPLSLEQIKSNITARNQLGHVMGYSVVNDTYTPSSKLPGSYQMIFQATQNLITKNFILDIRIYDLASPVISIPEVIEIPLTEKIDANQIKTMLLITDNVDTIPNSSLSILEDTYTTASSVGTYHILFEASDFSGNKSTLEVPVTLVDKKGPVIHGPELIYLYTTDQTLSNAQILSKYHAIDDVDGEDMNITISYNLYNQKVIPGSYQVTLSSIDLSSNITNKNIWIHVIDNKGPVFETNDQVIEKTVAETMSEADIINWLRTQLELSGIEASNIAILFNEYETNEKFGGSYYVYLTYETNGLSQTSRVRIDVTEEEKNNPYVLYITISSVILLGGFGVTYYVKKKRI